MRITVMPVDRLTHTASSDHSPCVGHCTYDEDEVCLSCRRRTSEIEAWRDADAGLRQSAWARIPSEIDDAGVTVMRLPLDPDDIAVMAKETLADGGAWAVGVAGHWVYGHDLITDDGGVLVAANAEDTSARITLDLSGKMRVLAWARDGRKLAGGVHDLPILIVVPRARIKTEPNQEQTTLDDGRVDLGYGLPSAKIIRDGDNLVIETLLATAQQKSEILPSPGARAVPPDLNLPESYVLAAMLLPKGETPLG
jgi:predicted Fe-S protein YdhL (DUF1289 family)